MDNDQLLKLDKALVDIARRSPDHLHIVHTVRSHTHEATVELRAFAIIAFVSAALATLLKEKNPYFLSTAASAVGLLFASTGLLALAMKARCDSAIQKLKQEHPIRLKHILLEIRSKILELAPVVDEVESELFPPES